MEAVFVLRDRLRALYAEWDFIILPVLRFLLSVFCLRLLGEYMGFEGRAAAWSTVLLLSLPCAVFPSGCISLMAALYVLLGLYGLSAAHALIAFAVFFLIIVLYFGFAPGHGVILCLVPVSFILGIPYLVPVILGMSLGIFSAIPAVIGVFLYYMLRFLKAQVSLESAPAADLIKSLAASARELVMNKEMLMVMLSFALCVAVVYLISHSGMLHAWSIAVAAGLVLLAVMMLLAGSYQGEHGFGMDLLGLFVSALLALAYEYLFYQVDYARTEHLQLEDDDYFYYVKAIPKVKPYDESLRKE